MMSPMREPAGNQRANAEKEAWKEGKMNEGERNHIAYVDYYN